MNQQEFENTLQHFLRREPFTPFVIELNDGRIIPVVEPSVAYHPDAAVYISPGFAEIIDFAREEVREFRAAALEAFP